jgi:hypothetical protein
MNVRLEYSMGFTAGLWWEGRLIMNNYMVRTYMVTNCSEPANQNIAFERLKYFVYSELANTVFVHREHQTTCQQFVSAGIKVTTLPAEPVDQLIGIMLYCKLNAVMEDRIIINEIEVSSNLGENMIYLHAADENLGPYDTAGWWHDSDPIHCDPTLVDSDKVVAMHQAGAWRELNLAWEETDHPEEPVDNTVVFAEFGRDETK